MNLQVQDDTAEATFGLWGTSASSPINVTTAADNLATTPEITVATQGWKPGETILLIQAPGWKIGRNVSVHILAELNNKLTVLRRI